MILKEVVLFLLIIISAIKYIQSLETSHIEEKYIESEPSFFMRIIYSCFFSAFYMAIAFALIEFKVCKIYQLFLIIVIYLKFFLK